MGSKWDIEKFTGSNDFGLWKVKMRAILTQQKCDEALLGEAHMPATLTPAEKTEMNNKALSAIILCLGDKVLREVAKEKTAVAMWTKLDALYMTKSLAHKQCLKERLFFFRMVENKSVMEQLSEFNKIIDDLANIDVNLEDEDKAFHLLCAFPKSLDNLKDALLYGKEGTITLDECKDLEKRPETGMKRIQFEVEPSIDEREKEDETQVPDESGSDETTVPDYQLARDRERRVIKPPNRLGYADLICYALNAAEEVQDSEPKNFREASESIYSKDWLKAMNEEMLSLEKNQTWKLVPLPKNKRVVGSKWVFKRKEGIPGVEAPRYKARLVAKGFTQVEGIDYNEIFSPVVKHCSIRVLMAIVNMYDLELEQMDVKTAFLHGELEETIYMQQPEGFVEDNSKVCLLKKSLYGLKQSPRQWYRRFDDFLLKTGFVRSNYDSCVYMMKRNEKVILYLLLYVDDILMASSDKHEIQKLKEKLNGEFEMKDLGNAKRILGMDILRDRSKGELFLSQHDYLKKVVERFRMTDSKVVNTPLGHHSKLSIKQCPQSEDERKKMESTPYASGVGSIMYGMVCSRPDLSYAISVVSRFMANPGQVHWQALKWVLRYLNGSLKGGLKYTRTDPGRDALEGYVDADYAGNIDTRKSLSGFVFTLFGTAVTWKANQQSVVALSTTQAEYIALVEGVKEAIWLKGMIGEMGISQGCVKIHCDSQSAIHLANHQVYHERTKHIDIRLHFVRDMIETKEIMVQKIASEENPADMFTKSLPRAKFKHCLDLINFVEE
ncbi:unnamed protein product [Trifolium pratense]|uniref:Uncharacterized protein n=1 Tax=Trifolium pratense TaxID=57577 RepID=A0ACB0J6J7_TRIPR|nr:unnamed protein product [Trifolium pratense]